MRPKELRLIVTFPSTTDAMALESYGMAHAVAGRLIPVPSMISAGCGMCWSAPIAEKMSVLQAVEACAVRIEGTFELVI